MSGYDSEDEKSLAKLGLEQVFVRKLNTFGNFCVTFSVMCGPGTIKCTLALAWNFGGPAACTYGCVLGRKRGPLLGWFTGWFSFIGEAALAGAYAGGLVTFITSLMQVNYNVTVGLVAQLGIYAACLALAGGIAALPASMLAHICAWGCWWIVCSTLIVALMLPTVAPWHQNAHFIFAKFNDYRQSTTGIRSNAYLFLENCLVAQFCVIGYGEPLI
ncbi:hypothetical protein WJX73_002103 [Symbiochloris irregularis]|uniref:Uncharacterized protein n=1 Tax=Symbiochloris irregularis TaxID=706552 RepID=A0AAW1PVT0_9CHLO